MLIFIENYTSRDTGITLKMNQFGDLTHEEFRAMKRRVPESQRDTDEYEAPLVEVVPDST